MLRVLHQRLGGGCLEFSVSEPNSVSDFKHMGTLVGVPFKEVVYYGVQTESDRCC